MDFQKILEWYSGKERERAEESLKILAECEAQGFWAPHASRKVRAALTKIKRARDIAKDFRGSLPWEVVFWLSFGDIDRIQKFDFESGIAKAGSPLERHALERAREFAQDLAPVAAVMKDLDSTRPKPTFTYLGVSPTITATLESMRVRPETIQFAPHEWRKGDFVDEKGVRRTVHYCILVWPNGTLHDQSRFVETVNNQQCQACGHAIKRRSNWIPLLGYGTDGVPRSLWVGRDCAERLFGIKVKGDILLAEESERKSPC